MKTMMRWALAGAGLVSIAGLGLTADQTPAPQANPDVHQGRRAHPLQELHVLPSARRNRADVAPDLRRRAAAREGHPRRGRRRPHAAVARGGAEGHVPERTQADRRREEDAARAGRRPARRRATPRTCRPAPTYPDGWTIGKPDVVLEMQEEYKVPATGTVEYEYFYIPTNFTEPKWIQAIEVRPGNREVVHHVLAFYRAQARHAAAAGAAVRIGSRCGCRRRPRQGQRPQREDRTPARLLATYAPGHESPGPSAGHGHAPRARRRDRAPDALHGQRQGGDRSHEGRPQFSKDPSPREVRVSALLQRHAARCQPARPTRRVDAEIAFVQEPSSGASSRTPTCAARRGSTSSSCRTARRRTILSVPRYDFNWQTYYMFKEPLQMPEGREDHLERRGTTTRRRTSRIPIRRSTSSGATRRGRRCSTPASSSARRRRRRHQPLEAVEPPERAVSVQRSRSSGFYGDRGRARSDQDPRHLERRHRAHRRSPLRELPLARTARGTDVADDL